MKSIRDIESNKALHQSDYEAAFMKFFKCGPNNFETMRLAPDGSCLIKHKDIVYEVSSETDIFNKITYVLEQASIEHIPVESWLRVAPDSHLNPDFILYILEMDEKSTSLIENDKIILSVEKALNVARFYGSSNYSHDIFWRVLSQLDSQHYHMAISAVAKIRTVNYLAYQLMLDFIANGIEYINTMKDGMFEKVEILCEQVSHHPTPFYIYVPDPFEWESNVE